MKIEIGKEYVTRSGLKVKVYDIAESGDYPVIAGVHRGGEIVPAGYAINGTYVLNREGVYDIVGEWNEPLEFDWSCLPAWINEYIAMDEDGRWFAFSMMPEKKSAFQLWRKDGGDALLISENYAPKNFKGSWEDSLFKNPNKCEQ
jgi:hypothetical protein